LVRGKKGEESQNRRHDPQQSVTGTFIGEMSVTVIGHSKNRSKTWKGSGGSVWGILPPLPVRGRSIIYSRMRTSCWSEWWWKIGLDHRVDPGDSMQRPRAGAMVDNKAVHLGHGQIRRLQNGVEFLPSGSKFRSTGKGQGWLAYKRHCHHWDSWCSWRRGSRSEPASAAPPGDEGHEGIWRV
jgi:hypothetical protein